MSELGAKPCSNPGCLQHDFLPFTCSACCRVFCHQHFAISAHACAEGEAYLASRRDEGENATASADCRSAEHQTPVDPSSNPPPLPSSKPSEVMAAVTARFEGREDELNATAIHYNIKASEGDGGEVAGASDKLLKNSQKAVDRAVTVKSKRVSTQVHRMLLKSKAVGDKNLRMEDRFFLEVHYCGNDTDVHNLFFSRMWTVGRALDDIVATRRRFLRLKPGEEGGSLELAREDSSSGLPTGGILGNLTAQLQSFDVVVVRPRGPPVAAAAAMATASEGSALTAALGPETAAKLVDKPASSNEEEAVVLRTQTGMGASASEAGGSGRALARVGDAPREGADKATLSVPGEAPAESSPEKGSMTITIVHGKAVYHLPGVLPDQSVLDIKRRLEPLTGVLFIRQKLVYKGILRDADLISATKVVEGARVMLLGAPATKK